MESAITVKGQATIPKSIREHLGLHPGDRVKFFVHPDGSVTEGMMLFARSVIVVDRTGIVRYIQVVPEMTHLPRMDKAFEKAAELAKSGSQ